MVATAGKQDKAAARSRLLWQALRVVERDAPPDARVAWDDGTLGAEEGVHFAWHLRHRGRPDLVLSLESATPRAELAPPDRPADLRVTAGPAAPGWRAGDELAARYRLGRRGWTCRVDAADGSPPPLVLDPAYLWAALRGDGR